MTDKKSLHIPMPADAELEPDYSDPDGDDFDALSRDKVPVRTMEAGDLAAVARIDRKITGDDRSAYLAGKLDEAMNDSAVRVSLVALPPEDGSSNPGGEPVGFIMAKVDFGDYGRAETNAVIDTVGVDPGFAGKGIGHALLSQLMVNLSGLQVETLETQVARENFDLLGFLYSCGFEPSQRLVFAREV